MTTLFQFEKFSETIGNAAIDHQKNVRDGFEQFANTLTASSQSASADWPYYTLPLYESYAQYTRQQTGAEMMIVASAVTSSERASFEEWSSEHYYEEVAESHMIGHGNLDKLPNNSTFIPGILGSTPEGNKPDMERESYFSALSWSPPLYSFG
mgnify:CR=1 FL=1